MKTIISILATALLGYIGYDIYISRDNVTNKTFNEYREEFRAEVDTLKIKLDSLKKTTYRIEKNTDSIKVGQAVIYKQIKEHSNSPFLENLKSLF